MKKVKKKRPSASLSKRKREESLGLLLLILGILVFIALFTYQPGEVPKNIRVGSIHNGLGVAGVYVSYYLIRYTIGYPIFFLPFLAVIWGWNRFKGKNPQKLIRWSLYVFLFALYISMAGVLLAGNKTGHFSNSGYVGTFLANFFMGFLGRFGSVVTLLGLIMLTVLVATEISYAKFYDMIVASVSRLINWFRLIIKIIKDRRKSSVRLKYRKMLKPKIQTQSLPSQEQEKPAKKVKPKHIIAEQLDFDLQDAGDESKHDINPPARPETAEPFQFPSLDLLTTPPDHQQSYDKEELLENARLLELKLADFGVHGKVVEINPGPVITRYEIEPASGIKVSRFTSLADDLAMVMRAKRVRVVAPIPGKAAIGIEIPNSTPLIVYLKEILASETFKESGSPLTIALGKTISGKPYVTDLTRMPHLLVAGSTGSGKSVCLNTIITSILFNAHPRDVQFVMIDPKRLELSIYSQLKNHYITYLEGIKEYVATSPPNAIAVLRSLEIVMEKRYEMLAGAGVRSIEEFNNKLQEGLIKSYDDEEPLSQLPYLILVIDELADLMIASAQEVEEPIARLTQMSRAVGIHLIVATQRPSVDVITGVIKANFPARIAFQVASKTDSRTILDMNGAEKLLGRGDMLFLPPASPDPVRIHTAYISSEEIESVVSHICAQPTFLKSNLPAWEEQLADTRSGRSSAGQRDPLFNEALKLIVRHQQGSVSLIQRRLKVGYSRAARLIDELEDAGVVGPFEGSKAREVLITEEDLEDYHNNQERELDDYNSNY